MNFFSEEWEEMHNEAEQLIRQDRASELEINWLPALDKQGKPILTKKGNVRRQYMINGRLQTCRIKKYLVTLHGCTCVDFRQRHLPCKHMYKLASRLGLFIRRDERSRQLIADFSKGYSDGWKFFARPCNYEDLDIKWQKLVVQDGGREIKKPVLTQGKQYNFRRGAIFYDVPEAYEMIWCEARQVLTFRLQVDFTAPNFGYPVVSWVNNHFERRNEIDYGIMKFTVYTPTANKKDIERVNSYACKQDEFVSLLRTGTFVDVNGEIITLL